MDSSLLVSVLTDAAILNPLHNFFDHRQWNEKPFSGLNLSTESVGQRRR
jgi:hypothetical protein